MEGIRERRMYERGGGNILDLFHRHSGERDVPEKILHPTMMRERLSCSPGVRITHKRQDWTERMQSPENDGFYNTVTEVKGPQKVFSKEGIRWDVGISIIVLFAAVAAVILLIDFAGLFASDADSYRTRMNGIMAKNDVMTQELQKISSDNNAYREAIKHDLVYAGGIKTVYLTAPMNDLTVLKEDGNG